MKNAEYGERARPSDDIISFCFFDFAWMLFIGFVPDLLERPNHKSQITILALSHRQKFDNFLCAFVPLGHGGHGPKQKVPFVHHISCATSVKEKQWSLRLAALSIWG